MHAGSCMPVHACRFMHAACSMHAACMPVHACRFMHAAAIAGPCMPVHASACVRMVSMRTVKKCQVNLGSKSSGLPNIPDLIIKFRNWQSSNRFSNLNQQSNHSDSQILRFSDSQILRFSDSSIRLWD
jgi:hypothetical protein